MWKTPFDNPRDFERLTLAEVIERKREDKLCTSNCNLWDGNEAFASKTIDPYPHTLKAGTVVCLYSGVATVRYPLDHVVYLKIEE